VHARRKFVEAENLEPVLCQKALAFIALLYAIEERGRNLLDQERLLLRAQESKPIVDAFFTWLSSAFTEKATNQSFPQSRQLCFGTGTGVTRIS